MAGSTRQDVFKLVIAVQTLPRVHFEKIDCLESDIGDIRKLPEESHEVVLRGQQLSFIVQFVVHCSKELEND